MAQIGAQTPLAGDGGGYAARIFNQIEAIIDENRGKAGALIRVLEQAQGLIGYLPIPVLKTIARGLKVPLSEVYAVTSFYHLFTLVPKGKYVIQVCRGTSCYVRGAQRIIDAFKTDFRLEPGDTTPDGKFSLDVVRCLGCCGLSPMMAIGNDVHRRVKPTQLKDILNSYP